MAPKAAAASTPPSAWILEGGGGLVPVSCSLSFSAGLIASLGVSGLLKEWVSLMDNVWVQDGGESERTICLTAGDDLGGKDHGRGRVIFL